jgi:hypothetical protein
MSGCFTAATLLAQSCCVALSHLGLANHPSISSHNYPSIRVWKASATGRRSSSLREWTPPWLLETRGSGTTMPPSIWLAAQCRPGPRKTVSSCLVNWPPFCWLSCAWVKRSQAKPGRLGGSSTTSLLPWSVSECLLLGTLQISMHEPGGTTQDVTEPCNCNGEGLGFPSRLLDCHAAKLGAAWNHVDVTQ